MALPPDASLDDVIVKIRTAYSNPNIGNVRQVVLKDGPRTFRVATLLDVIDPKTSQLHHYSLKIDHIEKLKAGWFAKPERSVRLEGDSPNEIDKLYRFLHALYGGQLADGTGDLHVIRREDYATLESLLVSLPNLATTDKLQIVKVILSRLSDSSSDIADFAMAFQRGHPDTLKHIAAASRMVEYKRAYEFLKQLIDDPSTPESAFQNHLKDNPWMFGSEYSELLPRRRWTRDDNLDFMLRRTTDGYLEIIEIKTAFEESLFIYDESHDCWYPSSKLSPVIGQVMRYIEETERSRDSIRSEDGCDTLKIRAIAILGRDGDPSQQGALRNFNSHLHGLVIMTFDQLLRIAGRVIAVFEGQSTAEQYPASDGSRAVF